MDDDVIVRTDEVFGTTGTRDLRCDIYEPNNAEKARPAVVLLHGGAWRMGNKNVMQGYGERLARAGFVGVASEYRLTPEAPWPAHIHDTKAAIRWTRAHASELSIDPNRIAILGRSAGGHLALLAAGTPGLEAFEGSGGNPGVDTSVQAAVGIFPPTRIYFGEGRERGSSPARSLLGDTATRDGADLASPLSHVTDTYPPTFLLHGTADKTVPPSASMVMYEALVAAGVPVELHMYASQPHGFAGRPDFLDLCAAEIAHFLHRVFAPVEAPEPIASAR